MTNALLPPTGTRSRLASDPVLPGRDWLLDPAEVSAWFGSPAVLERVKYRWGESLRVLYRLGSPGDPDRPERLVGGRTFDPDAVAGIAARAAADTPPGTPTPRADHERHVVWWTFPDDRRLRHVAQRLVGPDAPTVVQYAPERSVTLRLGPASAPHGFAKVYAAGTVDTTRLASRYNLVSDWLARNGLSAPRAQVDGPESLVLQPMPGTSWLTASRSRLVPAMRELGRAIGQLHRAPIDSPDRIGLTSFGRLGPARLERSGNLVASAVPSVSGPATSLASRLVATHRPDPAPVLLHGDCHPGNVLVSVDAVSLVDLDQSALGAPPADLGSLLARLRYGALVGEPHADLAETLAIAFLDGYAAVRALPDDADLRWHTAAALLAERALRAVNRVRPDGLDVLDDVLDAGHSILDGGALV
jgi:hypothetical protein